MDTPNQFVFSQIQPDVVLVDVYAWLKAIEQHSRFVMEGVFRHAAALCKLYTPAVYVSPDEVLPSGYAFSVLKQHIGKEPRVVRSVQQISDLGCKAWVSLAVDFPAPFLYLKTPFKKVAILHDTLAGDGVFGPEKIEAYKFGGMHNDVFAYVSVYSLHRFQKAHRLLKLNPRAEYVQYGCFHDLTELPSLAGVRCMGDAVAVHSLYKRKRIEDSIAFCVNQGWKLTHLGHSYDYTKEDLYNLWVDSSVVFHGAVSDFLITQTYRTSGVFLCMSEDEGFSMPPMEAILYGVPTIILSNILPHREVYGDYGVNFFNVPLDLKANPVTHLYSISEADRKNVFERYRFENVAKELNDYLAAL